MITAVTMIFTRLLEHYEGKWETNREKKQWEDFDYYEEIRSDLGVNHGIQAIPKHKKDKRCAPSRNKHRL